MLNFRACKIKQFYSTIWVPDLQSISLSIDKHIQFSILLFLKQVLKQLASSTRFIIFFATWIFLFVKFTTSWESLWIITRWIPFWVVWRIASQIAKYSAIKIAQAPIILLSTILTFEWLSLITYPIKVNFLQSLLEASALIFTQPSGSGVLPSAWINCTYRLSTINMDTYITILGTHTRNNVIIPHVSNRFTVKLIMCPRWTLCFLNFTLLLYVLMDHVITKIFVAGLKKNLL